MTPDLDNRLVIAFERIASALESYVAKTYPVRKPPEPATITHILTDEEILRGEQQGEDAEEEISRWATLGHREATFVGSSEPEE